MGNNINVLAISGVGFINSTLSKSLILSLNFDLVILYRLIYVTDFNFLLKDKF